MNLSKFSIKRPITTIMIFAAFCLMGLIAVTRLPVELYPDIAFGRVSIITYIRGGVPPAEVESMVTEPIEEAVSTVSNLESMLSISKEGESTVVLNFKRGIDMELAAMEVREKFATVKDDMPPQAERPVIAQFSQTDLPIVNLAVTSRRKTTEELRKIVDETMEERLRRISGVANVQVGGGRERKIIIEVDKRALYRYSLPINQLISVLGADNLNLLTGELEETRKNVLIRVIGQYESVEAIRNAPVLSRPDGSVVKVGDIAEVRDSFLDPTTYARANEMPIVSLYVQKESTANTIEVAGNILDEVEVLRTILPADLEIMVTQNQADFISNSLYNLREALFRGGVMIMFILLLFMGKLGKDAKVIIPVSLFTVILAPDFLLYIIMACLLLWISIKKRHRPILIVALSIPISLTITFGFMDLANMLIADMVDLSINYITLFGLALGVGMLVDNSIVVFENIITKSEKGLGRIEAAIEGSSEMNIVIFASTLTTVIVFLPMLFVSESMSMMYGGVAWTVTLSLFVSLFVALMVVPLLSSRIKLVKSKGTSARFKRTMLAPVYKFQEKALFFVFKRRFLMLFIALAAFLTAVFAYTRMGKEFLGITEQNRFTIFVELPTGAKLDSSDRVVRQVEEILREVPEVDTFTSRVESWSSKIYVDLVSLEDRHRSVTEVIDSLRPQVKRLQPAFIYFQEDQEVGTEEVILNVYGYDYDILREIAIAMTTRLGQIPYLSDVKIRMREGRPELNINVDKEKSARAGFSVRHIADVVHAKVRGVRATMFHTRASEIETIVRKQEQDRRTVRDIHALSVAETGEDRMQLTQLANFRYSLGPSEIWRMNRARMIQVSANIGDMPLSRAVEGVKGEFEGLRLPEDYFYEIGGNYEDMIQTQREFSYTIIVIVILIYLVLASIFESYRQPFIIMITVLLATVGAIGTLFLTGTSIGMGALIGMMMLSGIVVNNGIILVDQANNLRGDGKNLFRVLFKAARDRLRPVLMTTATTVFGLLPMALDKSEGSNLWNPLALTVIGGLLFATPLTLVMVPAIYSIIEDPEKIKEFLKLENLWRAIKDCPLNVFVYFSRDENGQDQDPS